jgi:hypothetical protein
MNYFKYNSISMDPILSYINMEVIFSNIQYMMNFTQIEVDGTLRSHPSQDYFQLNLTWYMTLMV